MATTYTDHGETEWGLPSNIKRGYVVTACDRLGNCTKGLSTLVSTPDVKPPLVDLPLSEIEPARSAKSRLVKGGQDIVYRIYTDEEIDLNSSYLEIAHVWARDRETNLPDANSPYPIYHLPLAPITKSVNGEVVTLLNTYLAKLTVPPDMIDGEYYPYLHVCDTSENCTDDLDDLDLAAERPLRNIRVDQTPPIYPLFLHLNVSLDTHTVPYFSADPKPDNPGDPAYGVINTNSTIVAHVECPGELLVFIKPLDIRNDDLTGTITADILNSETDAPENEFPKAKMNKYTFWQTVTIPVSNECPNPLPFPKEPQALPPPTYTTYDFRFNTLRGFSEYATKSPSMSSEFTDGAYQIKLLSLDLTKNMSQGDYPADKATVESQVGTTLAELGFQYETSVVANKIDSFLNSFSAKMTGGEQATYRNDFIAALNPATTEHLYARKFSTNVDLPPGPSFCFVSTQYAAQINTIPVTDTSNAAEVQKWQCYQEVNQAGDIPAGASKTACEFIFRDEAQYLPLHAPDPTVRTVFPENKQYPVWETGAGLEADNASTILTHQYDTCFQTYRHIDQGSCIYGQQFKTAPPTFSPYIYFKDTGGKWNDIDDDMFYLLQPRSSLKIRRYKTLDSTYVDPVPVTSYSGLGAPYEEPVEITPVSNPGLEGSQAYAVPPALCDSDRQCFSAVVNPRLGGFLRYKDTNQATVSFNPYVRSGPPTTYKNYIDTDGTLLLDFLHPNPDDDTDPENPAFSKASGVWEFRYQVHDRYDDDPGTPTPANLAAYGKEKHFFRAAQLTSVYSPRFPDIVCSEYPDNSGTEFCYLRSNFDFSRVRIDYNCLTRDIGADPVCYYENKPNTYGQLEEVVFIASELLSTVFRDQSDPPLNFPLDPAYNRPLIACKGEKDDFSMCFRPKYPGPYPLIAYTDLIKRTQEEKITIEELMEEFICDQNLHCVEIDNRRVFKLLPRQRDCYIPNNIVGQPDIGHCRPTSYNYYTVEKSRPKSPKKHLELLCNSKGKCYHLLYQKDGEYGPPLTNETGWNPVEVVDHPELYCWVDRLNSENATAADCLAYYGDVNVHPPNSDAIGKRPDLVCDAETYLITDWSNPSANAHCFQPQFKGEDKGVADLPDPTQVHHDTSLDWIRGPREMHFADHQMMCMGDASINDVIAFSPLLNTNDITSLIPDSDTAWAFSPTSITLGNEIVTRDIAGNLSDWENSKGDGEQLARFDRPNLLVPTMSGEPLIALPIEMFSQPGKTRRTGENTWLDYHSQPSGSSGRVACRMLYDRSYYGAQPTPDTNIDTPIWFIPWAGDVNDPTNKASNPLKTLLDNGDKPDQYGVLRNKSFIMNEPGKAIRIAIRLDQLRKNEATPRNPDHELFSHTNTIDGGADGLFHTADNHFINFMWECYTEYPLVSGSSFITGPNATDERRIHFDIIEPTKPKNVIICASNTTFTEHKCFGSDGSETALTIDGVVPGVVENAKKGINTLPVLDDPDKPYLTVRFQGDHNNWFGSGNARVILRRKKPHVLNMDDTLWSDVSPESDNQAGHIWRILPTADAQDRNFQYQYPKTDLSFSISQLKYLHDGLYELVIQERDLVGLVSETFTTEFEIDRGLPDLPADSVSMYYKHTDETHYKSKGKIQFKFDWIQPFTKVSVEVRRYNNTNGGPFNPINGVDIRNVGYDAGKDQIMCELSLFNAVDAVNGLSTEYPVQPVQLPGQPAPDPVAPAIIDLYTHCNFQAGTDDRLQEDYYYFKFKTSNYSASETADSDGVPDPTTDSDVDRGVLIWPPFDSDANTGFTIDQQPPVISDFAIQVGGQWITNTSLVAPDNKLYLHRKQSTDAECGPDPTIKLDYNCFQKIPIPVDQDSFDIKFSFDPATVGDEGKVQGCWFYLKRDGQGAEVLNTHKYYDLEITDNIHNWTFNSDDKVSGTTGKRDIYYTCWDYRRGTEISTSTGPVPNSSTSNSTPIQAVPGTISYYRWKEDELSAISYATSGVPGVPPTTPTAVYQGSDTLKITWQWPSDDAKTTVTTMRIFLSPPNLFGAVAPHDISDIITVSNGLVEPKCANPDPWGSNYCDYLTTNLNNRIAGRNNYPTDLRFVTYHSGDDTDFSGPSKVVQLTDIPTSLVPIWRGDPFLYTCGSKNEGTGFNEVKLRFYVPEDDVTAKDDLQYKIYYQFDNNPVNWEPDLAQRADLAQGNRVVFDWAACPALSGGDADRVCEVTIAANASTNHLYKSGYAFTFSILSRDAALGSSITVKLATGVAPAGMQCVAKDTHDKTAATYTSVLAEPDPVNYTFFMDTYENGVYHKDADPQTLVTANDFHTLMLANSIYVFTTPFDDTAAHFYRRVSQSGSLPLTNISPNEAGAICISSMVDNDSLKRFKLPNNIQYFKASRGVTADIGSCISGRTIQDGPAIAGNRCMSSYQISDLIGNAGEITNDAFLLKNTPPSIDITIQNSQDATLQTSNVYIYRPEADDRALKRGWDPSDYLYPLFDHFNTGTPLNINVVTYDFTTANPYITEIYTLYGFPTKSGSLPPAAPQAADAAGSGIPADLTTSNDIMLLPPNDANLSTKAFAAVRGGSYLESADQIGRYTTSFQYGKADAHQSLGFRCIYDPRYPTPPVSEAVDVKNPASITIDSETVEMGYVDIKWTWDPADPPPKSTEQWEKVSSMRIYIWPYVQGDNSMFPAEYTHIITLRPGLPEYNDSASSTSLACINHPDLSLQDQPEHRMCRLNISVLGDAIYQPLNIKIETMGDGPWGEVSTPQQPRAMQDVYLGINIANPSSVNGGLETAAIFRASWEWANPFEDPYTMDKCMLELIEETQFPDGERSLTIEINEVADNICENNPTLTGGEKFCDLVVANFPEAYLEKPHFVTMNCYKESPIEGLADIRSPAGKIATPVAKPTKAPPVDVPNPTTITTSLIAEGILKISWSAIDLNKATSVKIYLVESGVDWGASTPINSDVVLINGSLNSLQCQNNGRLGAVLTDGYCDYKLLNLGAKNNLKHNISVISYGWGPFNEPDTESIDPVVTKIDIITGISPYWDANPFLPTCGEERLDPDSTSFHGIDLYFKPGLDDLTGKSDIQYRVEIFDDNFNPGELQQGEKSHQFEEIMPWQFCAAVNEIQIDGNTYCKFTYKNYNKDILKRGKAFTFKIYLMDKNGGIGEKVGEIAGGMPPVGMNCVPKQTYQSGGSINAYTPLVENETYPNETVPENIVPYTYFISTYENFISHNLTPDVRVSESDYRTNVGAIQPTAAFNSVRAGITSQYRGISKPGFLPSVGLSQFEAATICFNTNPIGGSITNRMRLPTNLEYYKASKGTTTDPSDCIAGKALNDGPTITTVGRCLSNYGISDLVGNVSELTSEALLFTNSTTEMPLSSNGHRQLAFNNSGSLEDLPPEESPLFDIIAAQANNFSVKQSHTPKLATRTWYYLGFAIKSRDSITDVVPSDNPSSFAVQAVNTSDALYSNDIFLMPNYDSEDAIPDDPILLGEYPIVIIRGGHFSLTSDEIGIYTTGYHS